MLRIALSRVIIVLSGLLLSACVTGHNVDVPPTYDLNVAASGQSAEGVVAFSFQINIDDLPCQGGIDLGRCRLGVYVMRKGMKKTEGTEGLETLNPFQLDATNEGLYYPASYIAGPLQPRKDMIIWKLPEGEYTIWSWYLDAGVRTIFPENFPELYDFEVAAGKATYLGRLHLVLDIEDGDDMTFLSDITDEGDTEQDKILEAFPQFDGAVRRRLMQKIRN